MTFLGFRRSDRTRRIRTSRDLRPAVEGFERRQLLSTGAGVTTSLDTLRKHVAQVATPEIKHGWSPAVPEIKHGNGPI
jgi:hypothetical protein